MGSLNYSSGNLLADRRAEYAASLAERSDFAGAAEIMEQALELNRDWVVGWSLLGDYRIGAGDVAGALAAYRKVEAMDIMGIHGASVKLAAYGAGIVPGGTDTGYVEALFDDYAARFEHELIEALGYGVPPVLGRMIATALGGARVGRAVDLGCGTGLMGAEVRPLADQLEGVDLSQRMLAEARAKGVYDRLKHAELVEFLSSDAGGFGLITAADVLNYCGPLPPVLAAAERALAPGGLFGFSLELHNDKGTLLQRRQLRYAHNPDEALAECGAAGFAVVATERMGIRRERGVPVDGLVALVRKPA